MANTDSFQKNIPNFRSYGNLVKLRVEIAKLMEKFETAGALELELPSLLDSSVLIDLYGEDIRTRAYVTTDPFGEKKILRPDFTVPIVQMHLATNRKHGKYSYAGPVWRSQPAGSRRPSEYYQVGFEYFHQTEPSKADAEIFQLFQSCTAGLHLRNELGDMGIMRAIVNCLDISDNKRRLLLRHLWRPERFKQLLMQLSSGDTLGESRATLFKVIKDEKINDYVKENGPVIGLRSVEEIVDRSKELMIEESKNPIPQSDVSIIEKLQALKCSLCSAPIKIKKFMGLGSELVQVCDNLSSRIQAMVELNIDVKKLNFASNLARTRLEYYDGFIFTSSIKGRPELPPVAQGGRYDALTNILSKGSSIPAVGGIVRPEILLSVKKEK